MKVFNRMCAGLSIIACIAGFIGGTAAPALAGLVTFSFNGVVDSVDPSLGFSPGKHWQVLTDLNQLLCSAVLTTSTTAQSRA